MAYDPDPPTRRIPPVPPRAPAVAPVEADVGWREEVLEHVRALRTALALVGVLAAAALGTALYAALAGDDGDTADRGASEQRVSELSERVDRLDDRLDARATKDSVADLRTDQEELAEQVEEASAAGTAGEDLQGAVDDLREDLAALDQRVEALEQQGDAGAAPEDDGTGTP